MKRNPDFTGQPGAGRVASPCRAMNPTTNRRTGGDEPYGLPAPVVCACFLGAWKSRWSRSDLTRQRADSIDAEVVVIPPHDGRWREGLPTPVVISHRCQQMPRTCWHLVHDAPYITCRTAASQYKRQNCRRQPDHQQGKCCNRDMGGGNLNAANVVRDW